MRPDLLDIAVVPFSKRVMGAAESRIQLRSRFTRLLAENDIPSDDTGWSSLLDPPLEFGELISLVSAQDVRALRDKHPENFETLLSVATERLRVLSKAPAVAAPVLSCIRVLSRTIPFAYEPQSDTWAQRFLWESSGIGSSLLDALFQLLTAPGFAVPLGSPHKVWCPGVGGFDIGANSSNAQHLQCRKETIVCILAVLSEPMYSLSGAPGLRYATKMLDKSTAMTVMLSILNFGLSTERKIWSIFDESATRLAHLSLSLLLLLISQPSSQFRRFLARIHRDGDVSYLTSCLTARCEDDMVYAALLWEVVQANESCRHQIATPDLARRLTHTVASLRKAPECTEHVRILTYTMLTLTQRSPEFSSWLWPTLLPLIESPRDLHTAALLDVLYNCSPFVILSGDDVEKFTAFSRSLKSVMLRTSANQAASHFQTEIPPDCRDSAPSAWQPLDFVWSEPQHLWYSAALWGHVYQQIPQVWNGTTIELFKLEHFKQNPSLRRPQGAVDAAADVAISAIRGIVERYWSGAAEQSSDSQDTQRQTT